MESKFDAELTIRNANIDKTRIEINTKGKIKEIRFTFCEVKLDESDRAWIPVTNFDTGEIENSKHDEVGLFRSMISIHICDIVIHIERWSGSNNKIASSKIIIVYKIRD